MESNNCDCKKCGKKTDHVRPILVKTSDSSISYVDMCEKCGKAHEGKHE